AIPPTSTKSWGDSGPFPRGEVVCKIVVPANVPLLFHSCTRLVPTAAKKSVPAISVRCSGLEEHGTDLELLVTLRWVDPPIQSSFPFPHEPILGSMSLTRAVPPGVPSLFHNSRP